MSKALVYSGRKEIGYYAGLKSDHHYHIVEAIVLYGLPAAKVSGQWIAPRHRLDHWARTRTLTELERKIIKCQTIEDVCGKDDRIVGLRDFAERINVGSNRLLKVLVSFGLPAKKGMVNDRVSWNLGCRAALKWLDVQIEITREVKNKEYLRQQDEKAKAKNTTEDKTFQ